MSDLFRSSHFSYQKGGQVRLEIEVATIPNTTDDNGMKYADAFCVPQECSGLRLCGIEPRNSHWWDDCLFIFDPNGGEKLKTEILSIPMPKPSSYRSS